MKAIIFDLGGVLVDYHQAVTLAAFQPFGAGDPVLLREALMEVGHALFVGELDGAALHAFLARRVGLSADLEQFSAAFSAGLTRIDEALAYAVELQARPGVTVAVISNTNEVHVGWLDANCPELAELDLVIMSNEVRLAKPDPAIYRLALELLELPAADTVFVDDLEENVAAARGVGMGGILHRSWDATLPALEVWLATGSLPPSAPAR